MNREYLKQEAFVEPVSQAMFLLVSFCRKAGVYDEVMVYTAELWEEPPGRPAIVRQSHSANGPDQAEALFEELRWQLLINGCIYRDVAPTTQQ